jgi:hypothetical protein
MAFENCVNDHLDPQLSFDSANTLSHHFAQLLGDPQLICATAQSGKHMSADQAAAWGLAGFILLDHQSPSANLAAIHHGNEVAGRVMHTTVASEGDIAAAQAAYSNIDGNLLTNPEGSYAQANLAGAIQSAQNKLNLQKAAATNGSGDNANTVQTQFRTPAEYQAFVQQQAMLRRHRL